MIKLCLVTFLTLSSILPIPIAYNGVVNKITPPKLEVIYEKSPIELMFGEDEITPIEHTLDVCHYGKNKTYMDYTRLSKTSEQYKFLMTMTIKDGFFYTYDGYMAVALGSYFGGLGERYEFTLSSGVVLKVIKAERKADEHTNNGCEQKWDKSVIEFVIDSSTIKFWWGEKYVLNGNFNNTKEFNGDIIKIVRK